MNVTNVTWHSTESVGEIEGYVLATYIRIRHTGKTYGERKLTDMPATVLTDKLVDEVCGPWAFTMAMAKEWDLTTRKDIDDFMASVRPNRAIVWLNAHEKQAKEAKTYLRGLVGKFTCTG